MGQLLMSNKHIQYALWQAVLGRQPKIQLTQQEYSVVVSALQSIYTIVAIEEEWDHLIENYLDLESEIIQSALRDMVAMKNVRQIYKTRRAISRKISNFLSSCRSYFDRASRRLSQLETDIPDLSQKFESARKTAYDSSLAYRFMEELRNLAQHRTAPLHGTMYNSNWLRGEEEEFKALRHSVGIYIDLQKLKEEDPKFRRSIIEEAKAIGERVPLLNLIRRYLKLLSEVHSTLRTSISEKEKEWSELINSSIEKYKDVNEGKTMGLAAVEFSDDGTLKSEHPFVQSTIDELEVLRSKNRELLNFDLQYVSNELIEDWQGT